MNNEVLLVAQEIIAREFSPELAGQQVGWVGVVPDPNPELDVVHASIVTANVGPNGAQYGYTDLAEEGGGLGYHQDSSRGFQDVLGLSIAVSRARGIVEHGGSYFMTIDAHDNQASGILLSSFGTGVRPTEEQKVWATGNGELHKAIRAALERADLLDEYPKLYYLRNALMCHGCFRDTDPDMDTPVKKLLIPDPKMLTTTTAQVQTSEDIIDLFVTQKELDKLLQEKLANSPDTRPEEWAESFVDSRHALRATEQRIGEVAGKLVIQGVTYIPVGQGPNYRNYPFMGAHPENDAQDFGQELDALRRGNSNLALYELGREIGEIDERLAWARQGHAVLTLLANAETQAGLAS